MGALSFLVTFNRKKMRAAKKRHTRVAKIGFRFFVFIYLFLFFFTQPSYVGGRLKIFKFRLYFVPFCGLASVPQPLNFYYAVRKRSGFVTSFLDQKKKKREKFLR